MLRIRTAGEEDIELIRELNSKVWPQTYIPIIGEAQVDYMLNQFYTSNALRKQMTDLSHSFLICYDADCPVAFASFGVVETGIYKLHKLYISTDQQGKGIGRYIINHIASELKATGANTLRLNVNIYNTAAIAFYQKTGFQKTRDEDIDIGNGFFMNDYVFELAL